MFKKVTALCVMESTLVWNTDVYRQKGKKDGKKTYQPILKLYDTLIFYSCDVWPSKSELETPHGDMIS